MVKYRNYMETLVEEKFDEVQQTLNCCTCEDCRNDIIAYALNQLPPKYAVSRKGEMFSKLNMLKQQYLADVVTSLMHGAEMIRSHPRHDGGDL